jgi:hypothetical protein
MVELNNDVIEHILTFLSYCEICRKTNTSNQFVQCNVCKRNWCNLCLMNNVYIKRYFRQFACLYCIRNERPLLFS